jgi:hypothetical protein
MSDKDIQDTRTITVSWCVANAGVIQAPYNILLNNLQFQSPDFIRLDLFSIANSALNDSLYVIQSNLTETDPIISFTGQQNFPVNLSTLIAIKKPISQLNFSVQMLNTANQLVDPTFPSAAPPAPAGTVWVSITFTLIRLNKYKHQDSVKMADNR